MIKIRYNTKAAVDDPLKWRVLDADGNETLAKQVVILCGAFTSEDVLPSGETKYHISCIGRIVWSNEVAIIMENE